MADAAHVYLRACRVLLQAFSEAKLDIEERAKGLRVLYALDFSELYAYAHPSRSADQFKTLEESRSEAEVSQLLALEHMLRGNTEPLILLAPHAIELQAHLVRESTRGVSSALETIAVVEALARSNEFEEVSRICEALEDGRIEPTASQVERLTGFLEPSIASLVAFLSVESSPLDRLDGLLSDGRIADLDEVAGEASLRYIRPDERVVSRWHSRLAHQRGSAKPGSDRLDALAMGLVASCNRALAARGVRVVLVTRSHVMHDIFSEEQSRGFWRDAGGSILRLPQAFSVLASLAGLSHEDQLSRIERARRTLEDWLELVGAIAPSNRTRLVDRVANSQAMPELEDSFLTKLRQNWTATLQLGGSLGSTGEHSAASWLREGARVHTERHQVVADVAKVVNVMRDVRAVRDGLARRLQKHAEQVWRGQLMLGGLFNFLGANEEYLNSQVDAQHNDPKELRTRVDGVPYRLRFVSAPARRLIELLPSKGGELPEWPAVVRLFAELYRQDDRETRYEGLLAMAYILAVVDNWQLAERFCGAACSSVGAEWGAGGRASAESGTIEAEFFAAVCKRKHNVTLPRLRSGVQSLSALLERNRRDGVEDDARLLSEWGLQVTLVAKEQSTAKRTPVGDLAIGQGITVAEGFSAMIRAEALAADPELRILVLNNRVCARLELELWGGRDVLVSELKDLERAVRVAHATWEFWPPFVLDTLCYGLWIAGEMARDTALARLEHVEADAYLQPRLKAEIRDHIRHLRG